MLMALFTTFAASHKEPLVDVVERIHAAFVAQGFGEPLVRFSISDPPNSAEVSAVTAIMGTKRVSSIERVLKRWPELERFARLAGAARPGGARARVMSNLSLSGTVEPVDFAILKEIARGVPKSFPCHGITLHFSAPGFSEGPELPAAADPQTIRMLARAGVDVFAGQPTSAGISVKDSWWASGRQRYVGALRLVEADASSKKLPAPPERVAAVLAASGKVRKTMQVPCVMPQGEAEARSAAPADVMDMETTGAIRSVVRAYRERMAELLEALPHDLPHAAEPPESPTPSGIAATGPKKPVLESAFAPMGYDCRGEHGNFKLQRRTQGHLAVQLQVDIGAWGSTVNARLKVIGLKNGQGFKAVLELPASRQAMRSTLRGVEFVSQFPIGGPERWRQIVENLAALVATLDQSFVPEIEAVTGASPEWFQPEATPRSVGT